MSRSGDGLPDQVLHRGHGKRRPLYAPSFVVDLGGEKAIGGWFAGALSLAYAL